MKIGCPAITKNKEGTISINQAMCNGCGLCLNYCKFGAINKVER
jgi:indolepyruvate ferredoxin oxidoreductase alpha subunit